MAVTTPQDWLGRTAGSWPRRARWARFGGGLARPIRVSGLRGGYHDVRRQVGFYGTCARRDPALLARLLAFASWGPLRSMVMGLALLLVAAPVSAQLYESRQTVRTLQLAFDRLYDGRIDSADSLVATIDPVYRTAPGYMIMQAMVASWRYHPISLYPDAFGKYRELLERATQEAERRLKAKPHDPEQTFFALLGHSLQARHAAEAGSSLEAVRAARRSYPYMRQGFALKDKYPEFLFSSGLYDYYRQKYPEDNPIYRPFLSFFPEGNKARGLEELQMASQRGTFTRTEAHMFLVHIMLHYEGRQAQALDLSQRLVQRYPGNSYYRLQHAEALIVEGRPAEALTSLAATSAPDNAFYVCAQSALRGLAYERLGDMARADKFYVQSLKAGAGVKTILDHYMSLSYVGRGRLAEQRGERSIATACYRKAQSTAKTKSVKEEANQYLRSI